MDGWTQIAQVSLPQTSANIPPHAITTHAFDDQQDLLWVGDESGHITSFAGVELNRYTSYQAHPSNDGPIKQLLFHEKGVISLGSMSVHLSTRSGITQWHLTEQTMTDLRCMSYMGKGQDQLLVAGCQNTMFRIDAAKGKILEEIPTADEYTVMTTVNYICAATSKGTINLLDIRTLEIAGTMQTGTSSVNDMASSNQYLVTTCWVTQAQGTPKLNIVANVYDITRKVQLAPIAAQAGAAFVQLHPLMSTTCIISSQHGSIQTVDIMNPGMSISQSSVPIQTHISGMVLAPSGEALAIIDSGQTIQLIAPPGVQVRFPKKYATMPLDWGSTPQQIEPFEVDADIPLSSIGMPFYRDRLLSAWSSDAIYEVGRPLIPIEPELEEKAQPGGIGRWIQNPNKGSVKRNQVARQNGNVTGKGDLAQPKFLSDQAKDEWYGKERGDIKTLEDALKSTGLNGAENGSPAIYRNVEIRYSRFGVEDFDFKFYNSTMYSGLETHIANSYNNPLLQLLRFTPILRNFALHHAAADCRQDICLLCELGFLCDTLEKAEGDSCQATNFLKAFSRMDDARSKLVLDDQAQSPSLTDMAQSSSSMILEHVVDEYKAMTGIDSFENTVLLDVTTNQRCVTCHSKHDTRSRETHISLTYELPNNTQRFRHQVPTFSQCLKSSIQQTKHQQSRGFCPTCRRYGAIVKQRSVKNVPDVLLIKASIPNSAPKLREAVNCWAKKGWLPERIGVSTDHSKFTCFEGEDLRLHLQKGDLDLKVYDLVGFVSEVTSKQSQKSHLVSLINVAVSEKEPTVENNWHLFNDFLVSKVSKEEALRFSGAWKMPSVLIFQTAAARHGIDDSWKDQLDTTLLYDNIASNPHDPDLCEPLNPQSEAPKPGTNVAIDTEFVTLQREELYLNAEGKKETVRPAREGLGRVSVVRGHNEKEGVPFIDDYIRVQEHIIDYQTRYSGLEPGDLDPRSTPFILKPLKIVYKKIWLLSNLGCIFIGHGLAKDFRQINIHVPRSQIIDTARLFHLKEHKLWLGLAYLAQELLEENVQSGNHDSIEDARTALKLWWKFEELRKKGQLEASLRAVYNQEKLAMWREKKKAREAEAAALGAPPGEHDGRLTPDVVGRASGPATPLGKRIGAGGTSTPGGYFESPLR